MLQKLTTNKGDELCRFADAENALKAYQHEHFPLVCIDWEMPTLNALTLCRRIRALPHGRESVILIVSGTEEKPNLSGILDAGADDFISDPHNEQVVAIRLAIAEKKIQDIKKREQTKHALEESQMQLMQSEKLANLGQLAAGVAHEINNPIGFVKSNLTTMSEYMTVFKKLLHHYACFDQAVEKKAEQELQSIRRLIREIKAEEDLDELIKDVDDLLRESKEGTDRVAEIVQSLKSFARLDESEFEEVNINEGLESTLKLVWNELKYKCQVHLKLGLLPHIYCCPGQLNQVFMNLIVNAAHAIENRGEIHIETAAKQTHIEITITDNGKGIAKEHLNKLFNPFFTTKPVGEGTGLGLSISYGIVKKHKGSIEVQSEPGKGATFTVCLPMKGTK